MRYTGRIFAIGFILLLYFFQFLSVFFLNKFIEIILVITLPIVIAIVYWAGKRFDKAVYYSQKDELTGIYNRRFIINSFEKIVSLAERSDSKLFVLVVDCDNFKEINDKHGHMKGDMVLSLISETLNSTIRKSDMVARWGGDEFLVIGQYKEPSGLQTLIQRIEENLEKLSTQIKIPVFASIGSANYPVDGHELFDLIKVADNDMYFYKEIRKSISKESYGMKGDIYETSPQFP